MTRILQSDRAPGTGAAEGGLRRARADSQTLAYATLPPPALEGPLPPENRGSAAGVQTAPGPAPTPRRAAAAGAAHPAGTAAGSLRSVQLVQRRFLCQGTR